MKKSTKPTKLLVRRETLRQLATTTLGQVAGGDETATTKVPKTDELHGCNV